MDRHAVLGGETLVFRLRGVAGFVVVPVAGLVVVTARLVVVIAGAAVLLGGARLLMLGLLCLLCLGRRGLRGNGDACLLEKVGQECAGTVVIFCHTNRANDALSRGELLQ
ncbi:hypothetical protein D3C78_1567800 [compost metagenome]